MSSVGGFGVVVGSVFGSAGNAVVIVLRNALGFALSGNGLSFGVVVVFVKVMVCL